MRIYINNNFNNINIKNLKNLDKFLSRKIEVKDIFSNSGIYKIENNNNLSQIIINDGDIIEYENYINHLSILVDKSIVKKIDLHPTHISNNHIAIDYLQYYYKFQEKSPLYLIVEYFKNNELKDVYFRFEDSYAAYSDADINNHFIKEDINKFFQYL